MGIEDVIQNVLGKEFQQSDLKNVRDFCETAWMYVVRKGCEPFFIFPLCSESENHMKFYIQSMDFGYGVNDRFLDIYRQKNRHEIRESKSVPRIVLSEKDVIDRMRMIKHFIGDAYGICRKGIRNIAHDLANGEEIDLEHEYIPHKAS